MRYEFWHTITCNYLTFRFTIEFVTRARTNPLVINILLVIERFIDEVKEDAFFSVAFG